MRLHALREQVAPIDAEYDDRGRLVLTQDADTIEITSTQLRELRRLIDVPANDKKRAS